MTVDCPDIDVVKTGPATAYHGDSVTFTFTVTNPGTVGLSNVTVDDDKCANVTGPVEQDGNEDDVLDPGETWVYSCTMPIPAHAGDEANPIHNTVTATGTVREEEFSATDSHDTLDPAPGDQHRQDGSGDGAGR